MGYKRTDDLLISTGTSKGTFNPLLEVTIKVQMRKNANKKDASEEEGATDTVDGEESNPKPINSVV